MDEDGVWAELLFPTFPRFGGNRFLEADDKDLALACLQAWNDWMLDEWCAAYPDRFIPQTLIPLWDTAARGARDRTVRGEGFEGRSSSSRTRIRSGCRRSRAATGTRCSRPRPTPACRCRCTSERRRGCCRPSPDTTPSVGIALCGVNSMSALGDLIFSGALETHPELQDRAVGRRRGLGAVRARTARLHVAAQPLRRRQLQPAAVGGVRAALLGVHGRRPLRGDQPRISSGSTSSCGSATSRTTTRTGPTAARCSPTRSHDIPDDEARQIGELNARRLYDFW